jgi:hypothetical protein
MPKAPAGSIVSIYYDGQVQLQEGYCLQTRTGRVYVIVQLRRQMKGRHRLRWHIKALVSESVPEGTEKVYPIIWYKRERKQR